MALARHFDKLHDLVEVAAARRESTKIEMGSGAKAVLDPGGLERRQWRRLPAWRGAIEGYNLKR